MIYLILFIATIVIAVVVVRAGAILLYSTGMNWENSKFQALSAFTNCGFTTSTTYSAVKNSNRRKIISWLMILGNIGFASMLITLIKLTQTDFTKHNYSHVFILCSSVIVFIALWAVFRKTLAGGLETILKNALRMKNFRRTDEIDRILQSEKTHTLARVEIDKNNFLIGVCVKELELIKLEITLLGIERGNQFFPIPRDTEKIEKNDILICYGNTENIKKHLAFNLNA